MDSRFRGNDGKDESSGKGGNDVTVESGGKGGNDVTVENGGKSGNDGNECTLKKCIQEALHPTALA
ncbi:hypothetical protein GCM10010872_28160 [Dyella flava]|nr:hypothetical protein GCM10010872_28160 [Dyella flava]